jgi:hypothetical protein
MKKEPRRIYEQTCSRCDGTGVDPVIADCACDCCKDGVEILELTETEAINYPNARRVSN